ncbi:MAG: DUF393 domain-containing protein [Chlorobiota bacterium]|nr:MAG: DUF393 domain-containing protein [Chlorobiota bacterium]
MDAEPAIIFFDGECVLCNRTVQWILRCDRRGIFRFASLQSPVARQLLPAATGETVILRLGQATYTRSAAVVRICWLLGGWWRVVAMLVFLVPAPLRDGVYRLIARYRSQWFGRQSCMIPPPQERWRFLE